MVRQGDKVRVRFGNLTMTNHPIHMHGYDFKVTGTDGGWVPEGAQWPEVSIDVAVGQMRAFEFVADVPGDWAIHCHKSHHTMNAMGHNVRTYIGVDMKRTTAAIRRIAPGYMPMGVERAWARWARWRCRSREHAADDDRLRASSAPSRWAACSRS